MPSRFGIKPTLAHHQKTKWAQGLAILMLHQLLSVDVLCEYSPTGHKHLKPLTMSPAILSSSVLRRCDGPSYCYNVGNILDCLCN